MGGSSNGTSRCARLKRVCIDAIDLEGVTGAYFDTHGIRQSLHASAYEADVHTRIIKTLTAAQSDYSLGIQ